MKEWHIFLFFVHETRLNRSENLCRFTYDCHSLNLCAHILHILVWHTEQLKLHVFAQAVRMYVGVYVLVHWTLSFT